jgi:hypothetical protein
MDSMSGPPDDRPTVGESAARALYEQAAAEVGREADVTMHAIHAIELDDYEVANLRVAIESTGFPYPKFAAWAPHNPLSVLNNGDWIGTVYMKLPEVGHQPNASPFELAERARQEARWMVEAEREAKATMHGSGFAVYLTDATTGLPIAIFAHAGHALAWAEAGYPGRYRIEPIDWRVG